MSRDRFRVFIVCQLAWLGPMAKAEVTYQYAGNDFQMVSGRYATSDSVSGTIQVPSVLPPNLANAAIALDTWAFSDGLKTLTQSNTDPPLAPRVTTDGAGRIVNWSFDFSAADGSIIGTFNNGPGDEIDQATDFSMENSLASNQDTPGVWMLVPEPPTRTQRTLSLLALAAIASTRRRRP
jgi:MYXO-CTERM domain-containing protein